MIHLFAECRIENEAKRYLLVLYLVFVILSSVVGDSIILQASVRSGAIKLNNFIVAVMEHIAFCDLLRAVACGPLEVTALIADDWILGDTMAWIDFYINAITFQASNYFICILTTSKFLMLKFPHRTRNWTKRGAHVICIVIWIGSMINQCWVLAVEFRDIVFDYNTYSVYVVPASGLHITALLVINTTVSAIIPTSLIILTTFSTLYYLIESRKAAERSGGRMRWQGMVTVTVTAICYCISVLPFTISLFITFRSNCNFTRTAWYLTAINIMSNFYIYSLTIPSFRRFIWLKVSTSYRSLISILHHGLSLPSTPQANEPTESTGVSS